MTDSGETTVSARKPRYVGEPMSVDRWLRARDSRRRGDFGSCSSIALALVCLACEPTLVVGTWTCSVDSEGLPPADTSVTEALELPWETGFENGFCDYADAGGFCYANPSASYEIVTSPVHSGMYAGAFHVAGLEGDGLQARCARHGILPEAAYYGAWFYVPVPITTSDNFNLFHFDGGGADVHHDLWDVSLALDADGELSAYVFDFLRRMTRPTGAAGRVPVGEWFHLEVYWVRAADATGTFELYVDGSRALSLTDLVTDDSAAGEWYVGSLATELEPRPNTLYVDDVSVSDTPRGGS